MLRGRVGGTQASDEGRKTFFDKLIMFPGIPESQHSRITLIIMGKDKMRD